MSVGSADESMLCELLARDATRLLTGRTLPLDLELVLSELQIELISEQLPRRGAKGYLRRGSSHWQIVVSADSSPRQRRFTIAHELGHYLIEARVGPSARPCSTREYWALERICSSFAAGLLSRA